MTTLHDIDSGASRLRDLFVFLVTCLILTIALMPMAAFAENEADDGLTVNVLKTVEISSSHRYCWFPTVHRFPTGEIMATMQLSPDEIHPEGDFSAYCLSTDGGNTWSRRYTMGAGCSADGPYTPFARKDATIWHLYSYPEPYPSGQAQRFHDTLTKFSRGGMEILQVRDVILNLSQPGYTAPASLFDWEVRDAAVETEIRGMPWGTIIDSSDGGLLSVMYLITADDRRYYQKDQYYRDILLRSSDGGETWNQYSTIAYVPRDQKPAWMGDEGPNEGSIVRLADNRLYVVFRTGGDGGIGNAWSSDDGKTWTSPTPIGFKGVAPRLHRLSNGALALSTGRPGPVVLRFSVDGTGEKWSHATELFTGMSSRYTDLVELEPGKLLVVYDSIPYGWHAIPYTDKKAKNTIYGVFVEVHKKQD